MAGNNIYIQVDFQSDEADAQIKKLNTEIASIAKTSDTTSKSSSKSFKGFSVSIEETQRAVFGLGEAIASLGIIRLGAEMAQTADKINKVQIAFEGMLGSGQKAADMMAALRGVASKSPFAFEDLAEGAQRLQAFGVQAGKIPSFITAISNASAALGGTKEKIDSIINAIGQMYAKDEAQSAQLFRGLTKQGIPVLAILQKAIQKETGTLVSTQRIEELIKAGRLTGQATADALIAGMQERFGQVGGGMMELVTVQFTKLTDEAQKLAKVIIDDLAPAINLWLGRLQALVQWFEELPEPIRKMIEAAAALAAAAAVVELSWKAVAAGFAFLGGGVFAKLPALFTAIGSALRLLGPALAELAAGGATLAEFAAAGALLASSPALAGIMRFVTGFSLLAAAMAGWWAGGKIIEWMEEYRKKSEGVFSPQHAGWLQDAAKWFTDQADKANQAAILMVKNAEQARFLNDKLRAEAEADAKKHNQVLTGLPAKLDASADSDTINQQSRQINQMIAANRASWQAKIIQEDKAMLEHVSDLLTQALEHAQAKELGGHAAVAHEVADYYAEIAKAQAGVQERQIMSPAQMTATADRIALLKHQKITEETLEKAAKAQREVEQKAALDRIADMKKASELEVELAKETALETATARATAMVTARGMLIANEQKITEATRAEINIRQRAELDAFLATARREGTFAYPAEMAKGLADILNRFRGENEKADMDSAERIARNRLDIEKDLHAATKQMNEEAFQLQNQNQLEYAQHIGDIQKALIDAVPAQTEAQKTAQANAAAAAEIDAANRVYEKQKEIDKGTLDDKLYALEIYRQAGFNVTEDLAAAQRLADAERMKTEQQHLFEIQKLQIEAVKKHNEAVIQDQKEVYDQLKSGVDKLWDALTARSETFAQRIANLFKTAFLTAAKDIVTSHAAAALTEGFGKGHVGFGGGPLRQLLGKEPIFGGDKMQQPGHLGDVTTINVGGIPAVPVIPLGQFSTPSDVTQNFQITTTAAALPAVIAASAVAAQAASAGGSSGGINATFSRLIGGGESPSVTPGFSSAGGGSSWTSNPFSQLPLFSSPGGAGAVGGGGSLESIFRNVPGFSGGIGGPGLNDMPITGGGMSAGAFGLPGALGGLSKLGSLSKMLGIGSGGGGGAVNLLPGSMLPGLGVAAGIAGLGAARQLGTHGAGGLVGGAVLGAASGALTFSALAALFPILIAAGPIGLIAAAGIGAAIGLSSLFIKTADQKVRSKVKQVYGVDISEKNIRMQIVQIAKDRYGGNLDVAIASPEVQEIVRMYSIATGKNPSGLPRPMYGATFTQSGAGGVSLQPVYQGGNIVANPYTGTTTTQYAQAGQQLMFMQLDPTAASQLLTGQVTQVMAANPSTVAAAAAAGVGNGSARDAMNNALIEPLTVMS